MPPNESAPCSTRPMPWALLGVCAVLLAARIAAGVNEARHPVVHDLVRWHSLTTAEDEARPGKKAVLYVFGATWCEPCKRMEKDLFDDPRVSETFNRRFIPVHIDVDAQAEDPKVQALRATYGVQSLPTLVAVPTDPKHKQGPTWHAGDQNAAEILAFLQAAPTIP